jgi:hypothetical protein
MSWRLKKQLKYGFVFLLIILSFLFLLIKNLKPAPTCYDNIKNQGETDVDCGGPCISCEIKNLKLEISKTGYLIYQDNSLDLFAIIKNPSSKYALKNFSYKFVLYGESEYKAETPKKNSFILPLENKYILELNKQLPKFKIKEIKLEIDINPNDWVESIEKPPVIDLLNYSIENNRLNAEIINNDQKPFNNLELNFIFLDYFDNIVGFSKTKIDYIEIYERKIITITLPPFSKNPEKVLLYPSYNYFQEDEN